MVQPPYPPWRDKSFGEFITSIPTKLNISRFVVGFEIGITVGSMSIFNNTMKSTEGSNIYAEELQEKYHR